MRKRLRMTRAVYFRCAYLSRRRTMGVRALLCCTRRHCLASVTPGAVGPLWALAPVVCASVARSAVCDVAISVQVGDCSHASAGVTPRSRALAVSMAECPVSCNMTSPCKRTGFALTRFRACDRLQPNLGQFNAGRTARESIQLWLVLDRRRGTLERYPASGQSLRHMDRAGTALWRASAGCRRSTEGASHAESLAAGFGGGAADSQVSGQRRYSGPIDL